MKKIFAALAAAALLALTGCGAKDELDDYMDSLETNNVHAQELPEDCLEIPDDWVDYEFDCGVVFKAPAGLADVSKSERFQVFADAEKTNERTYAVIKSFENDWEENKKEAVEESNPGVNAFGWLGEKLDISYAYIVEPNYDEIEELGYKADTRYDLCKSLLTITDEELNAADKKTAKAIRLQRGLIFSIYRDEAYIIENESSHVFIHRYADDSYWVNVMPSDDFEYCIIVRCADVGDALRIAATADIAP
ncbi:MAG: hypothetical protein Q4A05_00125 [Ruminococcus sp.]|nr:hypothetical protein [Ruminococcus sp.]